MARSFSILIAEPNLLLREKIAGVLARDKYIWCVTQVDGCVGLARGVVNLQPDFILADLSFLKDPDMVSNIRRSSGGARIFALVDSQMAPYEETARRLGLDGIIEKGHVAEGIKEKIRTLSDQMEGNESEPTH
jgi:AmiR/NasT family two-component response regulator